MNSVRESPRSRAPSGLREQVALRGAELDLQGPGVVLVSAFTSLPFAGPGAAQGLFHPPASLTHGAPL